MQGVVAMFAEWAGMLGWRSPARASALAQLSAGVVGDPSAWTSATGIKPQNLDAILAARPASVQDRWFARLYWLKPLAILSLAVFWIATGVIALGPGRAAAMSYLTKAGFGPWAAELWLVAGSLFDIAVGLAVCVRRFTRRALQLMLVVATAYLAGRNGHGAGALARSAGAVYQDHSGAAGDALHSRDPGRAMTEYLLAWKLVHVLGATVLFGTGLGIAFFMVMAHRTRDPAVIAHTAGIVVLADALFTASAVIIQPVSGAFLASTIGYSLWESWIVVSLALYVLIGACWLPVVRIQAQMRNLARQAVRERTELPARYDRLFRIWFVLGWPAFIGVVAIFVLMIFKPALW